MAAAVTTRTTCPSRTSSAALGLLIVLANALGYGFIVIAARALGPADFGLFSAVNSACLVLATPVGAVQVVVARRQAEHDGTGLRLAVGLGGVLVALGAVLSVLAVPAFHLDRGMTMFLAAANVFPMAITAALQGVLLGRGRLVAVGLSVLVTAATRVIAVQATRAGGHGVDWLFSALLIAGFASALLPAWQARAEIAGARTHLGPGAVRELLRANRTLGALIALSTVDLLLARHYLPAADAGAYALGSVFSKVVMWGTQFLALGIVPALHPSDSRKRVIEATAMVGLIGGLAIAITWWQAPLMVSIVGGSGYGHTEGILVWFVVLGTLLGLAQVLLYAGMATDDGRLGLLTWAATAALVVVVIASHHSHAYRILATALAATAAVVLLGLVSVFRSPATGLRQEAGEAVLSRFSPVVSASSAGDS
ncbi:polysaccharide biosynthesis protein [Nostocoides veronense]|uniref:Polysaccharide biosynthesis protein n=1 Tax=Nostocoides veronense TaxID=330836 RepID=A0ABN2LG98_9MICO